MNSDGALIAAIGLIAVLLYLAGRRVR